MSPRRAFLLCVFPALSTVLFASDEKTSAAPAGASAAETANERGVPALFSWADYDGDGRLDLAAVSGAGTLQLLANAGEGRFEDTTERAGLSKVENAALALWADYDGDGRLDLFVGAHEGKSRLFNNEGGVFVDMSAGSGLVVEGAVQSAHWLDHDGDGRLDLHVVTADQNLLYRGLEGGFFALSDLPLAGAIQTPKSNESLESRAIDEPPSSSDAPKTRKGASGGPALDGLPADEGRSPGFGRTAAARTLGGSGMVPAAPTTGPSCLSTIEDQANPGSCLEASTTPTLGKLYPISANLFVAALGNVGIGTTTPSARLDVAGTARITDTLTLAPSGDTALDVSTGSIYKGGALFVHTKGGAQNTALGRAALSSVTTGYYNTALGDGALFSNTGGSRNTAAGYGALSANTSGVFNTACGSAALRGNTTGSYNTASGAAALVSNTTGSNNTAVGASALLLNTTGSRNTASGFAALLFNTTGFRNTAFGYRALNSNTTGFANTATGANALRANKGTGNTACGAAALSSNVYGTGNAAMGRNALSSNTTGQTNTACGDGALFYNTTGSDNTACGQGALGYNTTGSDNIALGRKAGSYLTTGDDNIDIGNIGFPGESNTIRIGEYFAHTRAFITGIRGVTTDFANAIPVLIDSAGQLGTVSSSARFKEEIRDMGETTEKLLELRPVVFRYRPEVQKGERPLEYGLIAEEVAEVFPELVVYDEQGEPFTVKYHLLSSMLLNELKKLDQRNDAHERELKDLREQFETQARDHARELRGLEARLALIESRDAEATPAAANLVAGR